MIRTRRRWPRWRGTGGRRLAEQTREQGRTREQHVFARLAWRASVETSPAAAAEHGLHRECASWFPGRRRALAGRCGAGRVTPSSASKGTLRVAAGPAAAPARVAARCGPGAGWHPAAGPVAAGHAAGARRWPGAGGLAATEPGARLSACWSSNARPVRPDFTPREEAHLLNLAQLLVAGYRAAALAERGRVAPGAGRGCWNIPTPAVWRGGGRVVAVHLGTDTAAALVLDGPDLRPLAVFAPSGQRDSPPVEARRPSRCARRWCPARPPRSTAVPAIAPLGSLAVTPPGGGRDGIGRAGGL